MTAALAAACGNGGKAAPKRDPGAAPAPTAAVTARIADADWGDQVMTIMIRGDRIASVVAPAGAAAETGWLMPAIIDSHVHLAYLPAATDLADHGVAAAVDLAAPIEFLGTIAKLPLGVLAAGPMLTQPHGYPLDAWGPDGFGIGCADETCVRKTITELVARGAAVIKVALGDDGLDPALLPAAVELAHQLERHVACHALSDAEAATAADGGCDVLAHTPIDPLSDATVARWKGRRVISTLAAFGGSAPAIENLRRLRAAGAIILYGTDLGNLQADGPSAQEIALLEKAGLDAPAILAAMTSAPAEFWGLSASGDIQPGHESSFVLVDTDPRVDPTAILHRRAVWIRGVRR
jgi:imidazolonepropionase-like amidohydrolase